MTVMRAAASAAVIVVCIQTSFSADDHCSPPEAPVAFKDPMVTLARAAAAAASAASAAADAVKSTADAPAPYFPQQPVVAAAQHFIPHSMQMSILKVLHQAHVLLLLLCLLPHHAMHPWLQQLLQPLPTWKHPQQCRTPHIAPHAAAATAVTYSINSCTTALQRYDTTCR
jgi:hypothetical protein